MKIILKTIFVIIVASFTGCDDTGTDPIDTDPDNTTEAGIYLKFDSESSIISYTDDNPDIPNNVIEQNLYGPLNAGDYHFTAKLANDKTYNQQVYRLREPAEGKTRREYTMLFYFDVEANRWLYNYIYTDY